MVAIPPLSPPLPLMPSASGHCQRPSDGRCVIHNPTLGWPRAQAPRVRAVTPSSPQEDQKTAMVENAAASASKLGLGGGLFVGGDQGLLMLFIQPIPFLCCLVLFLDDE